VQLVLLVLKDLKATLETQVFKVRLVLKVIPEIRVLKDCKALLALLVLKD
jgi:hypothetical protein